MFSAVVETPRRVLSFLKKHSQHIAKIVAVAGIFVIGGQITAVAPTDVEILYRLGEAHADIRELRVSFRRDGQEQKGARFTERDGFASELCHTVELPPGRYDVLFEVRGPDLSYDVTRALEVPSEGVVSFDVFDVAVAQTLTRGAADDRATLLVRTFLFHAAANRPATASGDPS